MSPFLVMQSTLLPSLLGPICHHWGSLCSFPLGQCGPLLLLLASKDTLVPINHSLLFIQLTFCQVVYFVSFHLKQIQSSSFHFTRTDRWESTRNKWIQSEPHGRLRGSNATVELLALSLLCFASRWTGWCRTRYGQSRPSHCVWKRKNSTSCCLHALINHLIASHCWFPLSKRYVYTAHRCYTDQYQLWKWHMELCSRDEQLADPLSCNCKQWHSLFVC